jgi:hypothetical protein
MTTNVPQDVIDDFEEAGFPVELMFDWDNRLAKFLELRAQRQQGAEPVAWVNPMVLRLKDCGALGGEVAFFQASDRCLPLYTTPPQANALVAAGMVMAAGILRKKADDFAGDHGIVDPETNSLEFGSSAQFNVYIGWMEDADEILAAIPADSQGALREVSDKVAEAIKGAFKDEIASAKHFNVPGVADALEAFQDTVVTFAVNSVLGEGGK